MLRQEECVTLNSGESIGDPRDGSLWKDAVARHMLVRIIEGKNGLFLGYPGEKRAGTDQFFNFIFPTRRELANSIQEEVLERFHQVMAAKAA